MDATEKLKIKKAIPICNILNVNIAAVNMSWTIDFFKHYSKSLDGEYICVSNVHTTVMSYENKKYQEVQNNAILALPDGGPLSFIGRRNGFKDMERIAGPDLMAELFKISQSNKLRHYFYGSTENTLNRLEENIHVQYPDLIIAGKYSPPFSEVTAKQDQDIINRINAQNPDIIWVGLGAPKQEYWMAEHKDKIRGLMIGVGAGFDYFAGNIKRAPKWMQSNNLEWLYRLIQEPKRLFMRYLITNTKFIFALIFRKVKA